MIEHGAAKAELRGDFTQGSIIKKMVPFMAPVLGSLVLQAMYGATDLAIVGRFGTTAGISGVSTGSNILYMITLVVCTLAVGVTVLMGHCLGEGKPDKIGGILGSAVVLFAIVSAVLCVAMIAFARPIAILMQSPSEALDLTVLYMRICGAGYFFIVAYNAMGAVFRGLSDSVSPLIFVAAACCLNIMLDLVFVATCRMNVAGAALATVIAQAFSVLLSLLIMKKRRFPFTFGLRDVRFRPEIKQILTIGIPLAFQEFLTQTSFIALVAFINRLGLAQSSGYGVANKINAFALLISSAIQQSLVSVVSQNVGAGKEKRAKQAAYTGMCMGFAAGALVGSAVFFFGDAISSIFTRDEAVIAQSWAYLRGFAAEAALTGILFSFIGYFNGHKCSFFVMIQGLSQTFIIRLPLAYIMSIQENASLTKIAMAAPVATCFGIAINTAFFVVYNSRRGNMNGAAARR